MRKMTTLGGYEIVDEKAREDINIVAEKADEAYSLAKGATKAFVYDTYSDMISELNILPKTELQVNYHVMIREVCVPDLWISGISDGHVEYTYTSNEDFIVDLTEDGIVQVGYFVLSALETQKVDLSEYVKNTDYAGTDVAGVVKTKFAHGITVTRDGYIYPIPAVKEKIDSKSDYSWITPENLDYATMKALTDCKNHEWTDEQKQLARALLGSVGVSDLIKDGQAGLVKIDRGLAHGLTFLADGRVMVKPPTKQEIVDRSPYIVQRNPITTSVLDYAVKKALSDCKLTGDDVWTDEEKAKALALLGGVAKTLLSVGAMKDTVALRDGDGRIYTMTPKFDSHAATKKYVDDLVTSAKDSIALKDASTGQVYNVRINNGTLEMVLVDEEVE